MVKAALTDAVSAAGMAPKECWRKAAGGDVQCSEPADEFTSLAATLTAPKRHRTALALRAIASGK